MYKLNKSISFAYFMDLQARFIQFQAHKYGTGNLVLMATRFAPLMREKLEWKYLGGVK